VVQVHGAILPQAHMPASIVDCIEPM
jgi:hypothetical protein